MFSENAKTADGNKVVVVVAKNVSVDKVKNGEVDSGEKDGDSSSSPDSSVSASGAAVKTEEEAERCEDARDEFYPSSPPDHCKVKPQLSFLRFVKSAEMMNLSEDGETPAAGSPQNTGGAGDAGVSVKPETNGGGENKDGGGDKKQLLGFVKVFKSCNILKIVFFKK